MGDQNEEMFNKIISEPSIIEMNVLCTVFLKNSWQFTENKAKGNCGVP